MGAASTDTTLETPDVALMGDDLSKLAYLYQLRLVPIWLAVLAGDAGMNVGVTGNAMGLSRQSDRPHDRLTSQFSDLISRTASLNIPVELSRL